VVSNIKSYNEPTTLINPQSTDEHLVWRKGKFNSPKHCSDRKPTDNSESYVFNHILHSDVKQKVKKDEMRRECSTNRGEEECI
jgi:hypothetical protein